MASTRTIHRLTEDWPEDRENFELQAFAASVVDARPELSSPALDRIESQLSAELDRHTARPPAPPSRTLRLGRAGLPVLRMFAPYAAAACLLVGIGVWLEGRFNASTTPENRSVTPVDNQPKEWQPVMPEDPARKPIEKPVGG